MKQNTEARMYRYLKRFVPKSPIAKWPKH